MDFRAWRRRQEASLNQILEILGHQEGVLEDRLADWCIHRDAVLYIKIFILYRNMFTIQIPIVLLRVRGSRHSDGGAATSGMFRLKGSGHPCYYRDLPPLRCLLQKTPHQAGNVLSEQTLINLLNFLYLSLISTGVLVLPSDHSVSSCRLRPDHCISASISQPNN